MRMGISVWMRGFDGNPLVLKSRMVDMEITSLVSRMQRYALLFTP